MVQELDDDARQKISAAKAFKGLHYQCPYCGGYDTYFMSMANPEGLGAPSDIAKTSFWHCRTCRFDFYWFSVKNKTPKWDKE